MNERVKKALSTISIEKIEELDELSIPELQEKKRILTEELSNSYIRMTELKAELDKLNKQFDTTQDLLNDVSAVEQEKWGFKI